MSCNLTTTTTSCIPCIHPFDYLFEYVNRAIFNTNNRVPFNDMIDRILDKGIIEPNCGVCCPDCDDVYVLASVETFLKFNESLYSNINNINCYFQGGCCSNVFAGVETMLKYREATGRYDNSNCCNGFTECVDELFCWMTQNSKTSSEDKDRILDKGIVEFGNIVNNCTGSRSSSLCKLVELLAESYSIDPKSQSFTKSEIIDRILDKGIVIYCNPDTGDISFASVETWLKYAEAIGIYCDLQIPALSGTTTTTIVEAETTTSTTIVEVETITTEIVDATTTIAVDTTITEVLETTSTTTIIENI
jgi:hypothetical protein